jgi:hypothetical protein
MDSNAFYNIAFSVASLIQATAISILWYNYCSLEQRFNKHLESLSRRLVETETECSSNETETECSSNETETECSSNETETESSSNETETECSSSNETETECSSNETETECSSSNETETECSSDTCSTTAFLDFEKIFKSEEYDSVDIVGTQPNTPPGTPPCPTLLPLVQESNQDVKPNGLTKLENKHSWFSFR